MTMVYTRSPREYRKGVMKTGGIVSIIAAATPINLYLLSTGRSCIIRKLHILNRTAAPVTVQVGITAVAATQPRLPGFFAVNGIELIVREEDLQDFEFFANITVQSSAAGAAPADVQVQATVEEFQGVTG